MGTRYFTEGFKRLNIYHMILNQFWMKEKWRSTFLLSADLKLCCLRVILYYESFLSFQNANTRSCLLGFSSQQKVIT